MDYSERLSNVAVVGAAGKMGRGITLLLAIEMTRLSLMPENHGKTFVLHAVDVSRKDLHKLMLYIKKQAQRLGERNIVGLRKVYSNRDDLIENKDIVQQYLWDLMNIVSPSTSASGNLSAGCIFEAVSENIALKLKLMKSFKDCSNEIPWFFTNTSSIPIGELDKQANLRGHIVGLHFYNPPAVQKLVEVASADNTLPEITEMALDLAKTLGKEAVISADVPGFIGNGHFMREIIYASLQVDHLSEERPVSHSVLMMNILTQDFLIRPMGIFQLIDFVGIDVCRHILDVMKPYYPNEKMNSWLLDLFFDKEILGGQNHDGSQKPGFFSYSKGKPVEVFDLKKNEYVPLEPIDAYCRKQLKPLPESFLPWKQMISHPEKQIMVRTYLKELQTMNSMGGIMAKAFLGRSKEIATQLVEDNVAESPHGVNKVMETGFLHAYGPINDFTT